MKKLLLLVASAALVIAAVFFLFTVTPKPPGHGPVISVGEVPDNSNGPAMSDGWWRRLISWSRFCVPISSDASLLPRTSS
jgi:hypothetical protein